VDSSAIRNKTAIIGVGYTPLVRHPERSPDSFALEAALGAIADAGLTPADIDGYAGCPMGAPGDVPSNSMLRALGLKEPPWVFDVQGGPTHGLATAMHALHAGFCRYALVLMVMSNQANRRSGNGPGPFMVAGPSQFSLPYGLGGGGGQFALGLKRYQHEYGGSREQLFNVVKAARRHAHLNPRAYWRDRELTLEEYLNSRWIYEPLCLFDCDLPLNAAGAVVLTTADRAKDAPNGAAYIEAYASTSEPGDAIFRAAGIARKDVSVAQLYDGFSPIVWSWLETFGFCGPGEAPAFCEGGRIELGGELPVNTFGGNLGEGRLFGFGHIREAAMQVMDRAGERQVSGAAHCVVALGQPNPGIARYIFMFGRGD
jgi:acetyl-CoA acetyltransferase